MLRPGDCAGSHTPQRSAAAGQFGEAAPVAGVVGGTEKIMPAGKLRGVLGGFDTGQR